MIYEYLFRNFLFPFNEAVLHKRKTHHYYREYVQNEALSHEQLRDLQWHKLTALLAHCQKHVPYYRNQWQTLDINWQDIKTLDDYAQLPCLSKEQIRAHYDELIADNFKGKSFSKATGGSTGVPLKFEYSSESVERRIAVAMRGYSWAGLPPGRKSLYLWGTDFGTTALQQLKMSLYQAFHGRKMLNSFAMSERNKDQYLTAINRYQPRVIVAFVAPLVNLAEYINKEKKDAWSPDAIITGAEPLLEYQREILSRAFNCPVFNTYGCREFMLIASECDKHQGLHINIDHLHVEITENGQSCPSGVMGEMTITDLHNYAMPFIRYQNGDVGRLSDAQCQCGRALPLMEKVDGRKLDLIRTPSGKVLPGEFFPHLIKDFPEILRYQVIQERLHQLDIKLVPAEDFSKAAMDKLAGIIKQHLDKDMEVNFQCVDDIPLTSSGKFRVTISKLDQ